MNKVSRLFGSVTLAAGLALSGTALAAGAAFADGGDNHRGSSYDDHDKDGKHRDGHKHDHDNNGNHRDRDGHKHDYDRTGWHKTDEYGWHKHDRNGWYKDRNGKSHYIVVIVGVVR